MSFALRIVAVSASLLIACGGKPTAPKKIEQSKSESKATETEAPKKSEASPPIPEKKSLVVKDSFSLGRVDLSLGDSMGPKLQTDGVDPSLVMASWVDTPSDGPPTLSWALVDGQGKVVERGQATSDAQMFLNWADVPAITRSKGSSGANSKPTWVATWPRSFEGDGEHRGYGQRWARSSDGKTWSGDRSLHEAEEGPEFGFVSLAPLENGSIAASWLDGRHASPHAAHGEHGGAMQLRARLLPKGDEFLLDDRVCDCCPTATVSSGEQRWTVFRDRSDQEVRDVVARAWPAKGGKAGEAIALASEGWKMPGCPVNGPAAAMLPDGITLATASFTGLDAKPKVELSFTTMKEAAAPPSAPIVVDDTTPIGRVDLVVVDEVTVLVTWLTKTQDDTADTASWVGQLFRPDGPVGAARRIMSVSASRSAGIPRAARAGNGVIFAWAQSGKGTKGDDRTRVRFGHLPLNGLN
jgi:hypothetical protein